MFGGFMSCARALRVAICAVVVVHAVPGTANAATAEAKKIFTQRCMACHTFGKGVKVGPDLKGVTERRQRAWLLKFIRSSQSMIDSGNALAVELFQQFKQQRMPDWTDLSDTQIGGILDWLAANGPDQREPDERLADSATAVEIEAGKQLFHGERRFARGGTACASCHAIRDAEGRSGGTLASDLTSVYSQYQDGAMTLFLRRPCAERIPESTTPGFLAPEESFFLKAYLRHAALTDQSARGGRTNVPVVAKAVVANADDKDQSGPGAGGAKSEISALTRVVWAPRSAGSMLLVGRGTRLEGELLFLALPYAALLILVVGICVRYVLTRRQRDGVRPAATTAWQLFSGRAAWRIGIGVTLALHLLGLLIPRAILAWNGAPLRLYLLEGSGFLFGILALVGWVQIMRRHVGGTGSPRATLSEIADTVLLSLLCMAIVSGIATAILYRWGSSWSSSTLAPYMQSLARGAPATQLIEDMPFLVRLHTLSWFAVIAFVPFTSAALLGVALLDRAIALIVRPINAATRAGRRVIARLSPARWLWPEEDALDLRGNADNAREHS